MNGLQRRGKGDEGIPCFRLLIKGYVTFKTFFPKNCALGTIQGSAGKSGQFWNACIYPCNGRTRLSKVPLETYRSQEEFDVFHVSIGHSELWLEQFEWWEANFYERHFHTPTPLFAPLNFFLLQFLRFPVINIPFIGIRQKEFLNFIEKHGRYELLNVKNCFFLGGGLIFEHFRQIGNFETPEKNTWR